MNKEMEAIIGIGLIALLVLSIIVWYVIQA
jgi:hypothetical protein